MPVEPSTRSRAVPSIQQGRAPTSVLWLGQANLREFAEIHARLEQQATLLTAANVAAASAILCPLNAAPPAIDESEEDPDVDPDVELDVC